jgi:hypothetical protein
MSSTTAPLVTSRSGVLQAILWGGFTCGVLDITAAFVVYGFFGAKPLRLLQGIAAGVLGPRAPAGGIATAALGLFLHFVIAYGAATVYVVASRWLRFLLQHATVSGALYGVAVYFFMNRVVVPLSAARRNPFSIRMMVIGIVIHIFCVGLPISTASRKYLSPR